MQLNHGRFLMNGSCGYVLMPDCLRNPQYNPFDWHSFKLVGIVPMTLQITVKIKCICLFKKSKKSIVK